MIPTLEEQIFQKHYAYYSGIGIETIQQQAGQVEQVSADYQGRVIYELLQNAFDKAKAKIEVHIIGNSLYIANDGVKFTYTADYDYKENKTQRGDFQSLCSISTSTKNAATSIGNKGVGFKSVFSIAKDGYVNVYTKGLVTDADNKKIDEDISFRIYDSFKIDTPIPDEFENSIKDSIKEKVELVHKSFPNRGVPGYYFPLHISQENDFIKELFEKGFVTIIEIPFAEEYNIKDIYDEVKRVHFNFIRLKHTSFSEQCNLSFYENRNLNIDFNLSENNDFLFLGELDEHKISRSELSIQMEKYEVALYINIDLYTRSGNTGKSLPIEGTIYNYLPTKEKSLFRYIDFQGDFYTTINRNSLIKDGDIGDYNMIILRACIELYFQVLNNYLAESNRVSLNFLYLVNNKTSSIDSVFDKMGWRLFELNEAFSSFDSIIPIVMSILNIKDNYYYNSSLFLGRIARKYFESNRNEKEYEIFFKNVVSFINKFSGQQTSNFNPLGNRQNRHKLELAKSIKNLKANVLPGVKLTEDSEILYKKDKESVISIPSFLDVAVTSFKIEDKTLREELGVEDFNDSNQLLKYFRQCYFTGEYSSTSITEAEQKEILRSLAQIIKGRPSVSSSAYRYIKALSVEDRKNNSNQNQANFNLSTIFLKTVKGLYKPAQLCRKIDLDLMFLDDVVEGGKLDSFLMHLGVSFDSKYIIADKRIYGNIKKGLSFIPALLKRDMVRKDPISNEIVSNVFIISSGNEFSPAVINDNYKFLEKNASKMKPELDDLLVKKYSLFPPEYFIILKSRIEDNLINYKDDIIRLYQTVFSFYHLDKSNPFLVIENNRLKFRSKNESFIIVENKQDFELALRHIGDICLLCFYGKGDGLPNDLKSKLININKGDVVFSEDNIFRNVDAELKQRIEEKILYLILEVSHFKASELDYLDDNVSLDDVRSKMDLMEIVKIGELKQEIEFVGYKKVQVIQNYIIKDNSIYINENSSDSHIAEAISEYFFNNQTVKDIIELVIFHRSLESLYNKHDKYEQDIIRKKWKTDYDIKFKEFSREIFEHFSYVDNPDTDKWFEYTDVHQSAFLLYIDEQNRLSELNCKIRDLKIKYDGYFDTFELVLDYHHSKIAAMTVFLTNSSIDDKESIIKELDVLSKKLGNGERLDEIAELITYSSQDINQQDIEKLETNLSLSRRIDEILESSVFESIKESSKLSLNGDARLVTKIESTQRKIYQNTFFEVAIDSDSRGLIGEQGEREVLAYYIISFLKLSILERIDGINKVYNVMESKLIKNAFQAEYMEYRNICLNEVDNDDALKRALIPFFYISLHHKYSYFDLIVYKDNMPTLVEVKTTQSEGNNSFYISAGEVDAARLEEHYEIVRVTPSQMLFLGNPIKEADLKLGNWEAADYRLIPRNYKFEFIK